MIDVHQPSQQPAGVQPTAPLTMTDAATAAPASPAEREDEVVVVVETDSASGAEDVRRRARRRHDKGRVVYVDNSGGPSQPARDAALANVNIAVALALSDSPTGVESKQAVDPGANDAGIVAAVAASGAFDDMEQFEVAYGQLIGPGAAAASAPFTTGTGEPPRQQQSPDVPVPESRFEAMRRMSQLYQDPQKAAATSEARSNAGGSRRGASVHPGVQQTLSWRRDRSASAFMSLARIGVVLSAVPFPLSNAFAALTPEERRQRREDLAQRLLARIAHADRGSDGGGGDHSGNGGGAT